jgi:hypothetical protein
MRADRVAVVTVLTLVLAAAGCTPPRTELSASKQTVAPVARHRAPAPANPDLGTVMERFYQQIEGAHWPFAYAMLSPRYRAALDQDRFVARYAGFADLDVSLRQLGGRVVVATIGAKERGAPSRARRFEEMTALAWDGEDWKIDRIERRELSAASTR